MKRIAVLAAALLPVAAAAQQDSAVDAKALRHAVPASALLEENVLSESDRKIGEVEDVLMTRDGKLQLFLLDVEDADPVENNEEREALEPGADAGEFGAEVDTAPDLTAKGGELDRVSVDRGDVEWGEDLMPVSPRDVRYDLARDELIVRSGASRKAVPEDARDELLHVGEIIGMEVTLADEDSFGSVEDVMLDSEQSRVVALVVDNWQGLDKQRRALPLENAVIRYDDEEIIYPYTEDEVLAIREFDLASHTEDGWSME